METLLLPSVTVYVKSVDRIIVVSENEWKSQMSTYFRSTLIPSCPALKAISEME